VQFRMTRFRTVFYSFCFLFFWRYRFFFLSFVFIELCCVFVSLLDCVVPGGVMIVFFYNLFLPKL
jgi:hypothetical protein